MSAAKKHPQDEKDKTDHELKVSRDSIEPTAVEVLSKKNEKVKNHGKTYALLRVMQYLEKERKGQRNQEVVIIIIK